MQWIALFFVLELGWMPQGEFVMYRSWVLDEFFPVKYTAYTDLEAEVVFFEHVFMGGGVKTSVWKLDEDGWTFFPHKAVYRFSVGARVGIFEFGFRHFCIHPVTPFFDWLEPQALWEGAYEEIYVRVSNR
jgi:hypothetical protein